MACIAAFKRLTKGGVLKALHSAPPEEMKMTINKNSTKIKEGNIVVIYMYKLL